jgi:ABC-type transporter Mla maintaining outer membrane lipid asymmetry permease subunit MlaE
MVKGELGIGMPSIGPEERRSLILRFFAAVGRRVLVLLGDFGAIFIFFVVSLGGIFSRKQLTEMAWQLYYVSATSTGIVILVGLFTGMVLGLQLFYTLVQFGSANALGTAVTLSLVRVGIIGGYLTGVLLLGANAGAYFYRVQSSATFEDVRGGFIKAIVFAVTVSMICCFEGYFCHMRTESSGAKNVGLATRAAAVLSCTMILVSDYVVTSFLT